MPPRQNDDPGGAASRHARTARDETIMRFAGLVRSIARRYEGRGLPLDDLVQVGYVGLIQAVDRFDPERGSSLQAYAARTIDGEIMHMFRDQKWVVRVPRGLQESSARVALLREELTQRLGREPTLPELADAAGLSVSEAGEAIAVRTAFTTRSMPEGAHVVDPDPDVAPEDEFAREETGFGAVLDREQLAAAMRSLPARERRILVLRVYGDLTQAEIAERVGISQMHVSRLLSHARGVVGAHLAGEAA
jgi:RNA polymerase sigma-B factor